MRTVKIVNETRGSVLAEEALHATGFWTRLRGLLGRPEPEPGGGLVLDPCKSVHMWGMRYSLDVLFSDPQDCVVAMEEGLAPWQVSSHVKTARRAIELPTGTIQRTETKVGDQLLFESGSAQ